MKNVKDTIKNITITMLITAIVAFIGGVKYEQSNSHQLQSQAQSLLKSVPVAQAAVPK